jgi:hypothetical protein
VPATTPTGRQRQAPLPSAPWQVRVPVQAVLAEAMWQPPVSLVHVETCVASVQYVPVPVPA